MPSERPALSLLQLNSLIRAAVMETLPDQYWVIAEIADIKQNQKGHCYLELVEKEENSVMAQIRATIWVRDYRSISSRFTKTTNETLRQGMKILFLASVTFHEVYGLSLNIKDIDPTYTMGEMARKKKEVLERLRREGIIDLNRMIALPVVPQRIAVISSPTAAGYGDFFRHLDSNPYGYRFVHALFPALMQGQEAESSIIRCLDNIHKQKKDFDLVVIIRGGGSVIDLNCFDGYALASHLAKFPLPVITGIGHEKDDTVADIVAHTKMKTPTAVADFLISLLRDFEETMLGLLDRITSHAERLLQDEKQRLLSFGQRLSYMPLKLTSEYNSRLMIIERDMISRLQQRFRNESDRLIRNDQAVRHLDPANVLKRGYSITRHKGKTVRDAALLEAGARLETTLQKGTIVSIVKSGKEEVRHGKKQGTDLLPGFE